MKRSTLKFKELARELLTIAGISINGGKPWDITVHNNAFFERALTEGELGIGESYMDGWWDAEALDETIARILRARLHDKIKRKYTILLQASLARVFNLQSRRRAFIIGKRHYDTGNDLFTAMLDKRLNYSCAYWNNAKDLDEAQENKLDLICRKIFLEPGMKVLDIGCGWGAFGKYAAEKYKAEVTGITVSGEQIELGRKLCKGLPVEFLLKDYRDMTGQFDRIVSVGMIEHVGYKNYDTFFDVAGRCLKHDGLFLLHTIGSPVTTYSINPWTHKYIFPNGMLPSAAQLSEAFEDYFVMEDWHSFGAYYDLTLMAWYRNFNNAWKKLRKNYSERFYRMWKYYLLSSAGAFRARKNQLWQIVLSKNGIPGGYESVR
ncbi:MAG TPA: cyclopropane fatty acyl phospholipid synthase [Bacteroidales bacterium]|nr:cyclopropane fatty acyl phospholipid synthase [Bacteroidales bacterium]